MAVRDPGLLKVADCVVADMLAHFTTLPNSRQNLASVKLADIGTPHAIVMPARKRHTRATRDPTQRDYSIEIGLFQRIDTLPVPGALTEDQLIELAEEVLEWWMDTKIELTAYSDPDGDFVVSCVEGRLAEDEPFDFAKRQKENYIHSIIQLDFRAL